MNDHPSVGTVPNGRPAAEPHSRNLPLGHWGGIKASAHWSTMVAVGLFAEVLATSALPAARPGHGSAEYWLVGLLTAFVFLLTLLVHELGHAWTARHFGIRVRGITLWLLGGVTELDGPAPTPKAEVLITAAGPAASLGLGGVSVLLARLAGTSTLVGAALLWLAGASVLLGVFNLLPGSPLDGGRLLRALLWAHFDDRDRADRAAAQAGRLVGLALMGLGLFALAGGAYAGLWLALVGWFILSAATAERNLGQVQRLQGLRAAAVMTPALVVVPDWWTVDQALTRLAPGPPLPPVFPLVNFAGDATGALTAQDLVRVPAGKRDEVRLRDLVRARRMPPLLVTGSASLTYLATVLRRHGGVAVVTDEQNHPVGVITAAQLTQLAGTTARPAS